MKSYEVVVLGAGSAGEAIARGLREAGKSVALVEKFRVGGECAYVSCIPSKAMLRSAQVRDEISRSVSLGASPVGLPLSGNTAAFKHAAERRDRIASDRNDSVTAGELEKLGIDLYRGSGLIQSGSTIKVGDITLEYRDLVIATGSTSTIPPIEGLGEISYWTSDQALSAQLAPEKIAIVGGGPVACELAQIFARFGSHVTVIEFSNQLAGKEHPEIAARLAGNLRKDGVDINLNTEVLSAVITVGGKTKLTLANGDSVDVDKVIIATGRHPKIDGFGLESLSIQANDKGAIPIDPDGRVTGNLHIWACGDVTGIAPFTHTANYQARIIVENILGGSRKANYNAIPRAIYTDPAVASVGTMAKEADQSHIVFASIELSTLSRNETDGESGGLLILAADLALGVLVGASAIGPHADEWLVEATVAIRAQIPLAILEDTVHAFPTFSQAFEVPIRKLLAARSNYLQSEGFDKSQVSFE